MALTPNGLVTISGSPSGGEQPTQNAGATMVAGVIVPAAGFIGIGSSAAQVDSEVFGVQGSARVSSVLAIAGSPVGSEKLYVGGAVVTSGSVGIGTTPSALLHASSTGVVRAQIDSTDNAEAGSGIYMRVLSSGALVGNATIRVDNVGNLEIFNGTSGESQAVRITPANKLLVGTTTSGASKLRVNDDSIEIMTAKTPATSGATGTTGQIAWDSNYFYVCVATNTWQRVAHATW